MTTFSLDKNTIDGNIKALQHWLQGLQKNAQAEALYLPSFDIFFNEYVPLDDCLRYFVSAFTGSVSEMIALPGAPPRLYVDGRYHEQADKEVGAFEVEIVKVPYGIPLKQAMLEDLARLGVKKLAIMADRTPELLAQELAGKFTLFPLSSQTVAAQLSGYRGLDPATQLTWVENMQSVEEKLARLLQHSTEGWFLTSPESVAWLTNARGQQFPYQATFAARALCHAKGITVFHRASVRPPNTTHPLIRWQACSLQDVPTLVSQEWAKLGVKELKVQRSALSFADARELENKLTTTLLDGGAHIVAIMANKTQAELNAFERSFERSDRAIWRSLEWMHQQASSAADATPSERQWSDQVWQHYQEQGASALSFKTIAGFGPHSSIIHYSTPSPQTRYQRSQLALLDSGGHFGDGICTDTTRTILPAGEASERQRLQYTLVLKGLLQSLNAVFPVNAPGHFVDSLARAGMRRHGFDYGHGTGHGIGVAVHEPGYSLTPQSMIPLSEGRVGSLEPGIYLPGEGGVRLENIVIVQRHPTLSGMLCFKNLVWIGFQAKLIELSLLNLEERAWLNTYQEECAKRGRALTF